ncbi:MAG: deoxyribodipyrimidine photo-lyase [Acidobacteriota bacterium]
MNHTTEIDRTRLEQRNDRPALQGRFVLYWMQQSQRAELNHALEYAVQRANAVRLPLLTLFVVAADYPEANARHYAFMLEGLAETSEAIEKRGVQFAMRIGSPVEEVLDVGKDAALIVCDRGYTRVQKEWRREVAGGARCQVMQVESDVIVPLHVVSGKAEYAARTIRPKILRHLDDYLVTLRPTPVVLQTPMLKVARTVDPFDPVSLLASLEVDRSVLPVTRFFRGGASQAKRRLKQFISSELAGYKEDRNGPETNHLSHMSMYLHFGQISPIAVALAVQEAKRDVSAVTTGRRVGTKRGSQNSLFAARDVSADDRSTYLDELIVRRELAQNFIEFTPDYDRYTALPNWARSTLAEHCSDDRPVLYTKSQLERSATDDPYWNASMDEMRATGYMHNYMRMYWGKKILEWSKTPERAFATTLELNNRYFLDGRGGNAFANVGWIFGLHDRPWFEREIFGKVRYMSAQGLERKSDIGAYVRKVNSLVDEARDALSERS